MKKITGVALIIITAACATATVPAVREGLVEYYGKQGSIVATGKTDGTVPIAAMSGANGAYGLGAYEGLDGEITVYAGRPLSLIHI